MEVYWSKNAEKKYLRVIKYLSENWTKKEIISLNNKVEKLIENIGQFKTICPSSKKTGLHKCVIDKNNSIIYKIHNHTLYIVDFIPHKMKNKRY